MTIKPGTLIQLVETGEFFIIIKEGCKWKYENTHTLKSLTRNQTDFEDDEVLLDSGTYKIYD